MPSFEQGDIVRVPFPYTDRATRQVRPALVVSSGAIGDQNRLLWVVMITSAENRPWLGDVAIDDAWEGVGLPVPSTIRPCKIATIEAAHADRVGRLPSNLMIDVRKSLRAFIGVEAPEERSSAP